ncbi:hypothetical protein M9H77_27183 [Catharanthus roseus]|uniref:Uncharacterized protein n=1 Tax=Catharanthus roseus TaxID=4058 RepID=A0ACC0ABZ0_CATRO|nr:hypothetical protein M9H77_27183 [Catharanthus roseus]
MVTSARFTEPNSFRECGKHPGDEVSEKWTTVSYSIQSTRKIDKEHRMKPQQTELDNQLSKLVNCFQNRTTNFCVKEGNRATKLPGRLIQKPTVKSLGKNIVKDWAVASLAYPASWVKRKNT